MKATSQGCSAADAKNIRSSCCALISLLVTMIASDSGGDLHRDARLRGAKVSSGSSDGERIFSPDKFPSLEGIVQMKPDPSLNVFDALPKNDWAARQGFLKKAHSSYCTFERTEGFDDSTLPGARMDTPGRERSTGLKRQFIKNRPSSARDLPPAVEAPRLKSSVLKRKEQRKYRPCITAAPAIPVSGADGQRLNANDEHRHDDNGTRVGTKMDRWIRAPSTKSFTSSAGTLVSPPRLGLLRASRRLPRRWPTAGHRRSLVPRTESSPERDVPLGLSSPGLGKRKRAAKAR